MKKETLIVLLSLVTTVSISYSSFITGCNKGLKELISEYQELVSKYQEKNKRFQDLETQVSDLSSQLEDIIYGSRVDLDHPLSKKVGVVIEGKNATYDGVNNIGSSISFRVIPGPTLRFTKHNYNGNPNPASTVIIDDKFGDGNPYAVLIIDHNEGTILGIRQDSKGNIFPDSTIVSKEGSKKIFDEWTGKYNKLCSMYGINDLIEKSPGPRLTLTEKYLVP